MLLEDIGIDPVDALHLSYAEFGGAEYFITCDDDIIKKAAKHKDIFEIEICNPLKFRQLLGSDTRIDISRGRVGRVWSTPMAKFASREIRKSGQALFFCLARGKKAQAHNPAGDCNCGGGKELRKTSNRLRG